MTTDAAGKPHPFVELEEMLLRPRASGLFLTRVAPDSPLAAQGARAGDIITAVGDRPLESLGDFLAAMRPAGEGDATRLLHVCRAGGGTATWEVPTPLPGISHCVVREGRAAWEPRADTSGPPDFSGLADGTEIWLRNSLGEERAGFEHVRLEHRGGRLHVASLFRLGGEDPEGGPWDYRTRTRSTHLFDRWLSVERTAFWEGAPGEERERGDHRREHPADPPAITPYSIMLLPLTMTLERGSVLTVCLVPDGGREPVGRCRLECTGRETVTVDGREVEAWCFLWRHYGEYGEEERFYVSDDRRLVRIDWGANYADCRAERVDEEHVLDGVPPHVTRE